MNTIYKGRVFSVETGRRRFPNGTEHDVAIVRHAPSVVLIPIDGDGRVIRLVPQTPEATLRFSAWLAEGQPKVVLKVGTAGQLEDVVRQARAGGLPVEVISDAGRTQVTPGTLTCCALGPAETQRIDAVTAGLALL